MTAHPGIILALAATIVYNVGFILEKRALTRMPAIDARHLWQLLRTLFTAPAWLAGFLLICCGLVLQILVLSLVPLTVAQPLQASGVVVTILFSRLVLHERLGRTELTCIGLIAVAVLLLSLSIGRGPGTAVGTHAAGTAIAAAGVPACLAVMGIYYWAHHASRRRHQYPVTGVSYALCAGLIYGVAGLALKALSAAVFTARTAPPAQARAAVVHTVAATAAVLPPHSRDELLAAATSPYLYVMLACSAVGMCLFQVALQRSPASIVMPISLVIGTGYLVIIGSWLFHERLPAGLVPLAMRLGGGVAAVTVPVILTIASERAAARRSPGYRSPGRQRPDVSSATSEMPVHDIPKGGAALPFPARRPGSGRRDFDEFGPAVAEPAGLPDRQAGIAIPGRGRHPVQPAAAPQLPRS